MENRTLQYLETILWCTTDAENAEEATFESQGFTVDHFTRDSTNRAESDLREFYEMVKEAGIDLNGSPWEDSAKFAHDFALSRNGHGAGFFDSCNEHGDRLQKLAKTFGETYVRKTRNGYLVLSS